MRRTAIYARVSTTDRGQDPETQLRQLREYVERRGFVVHQEYVDQASGAKNDRSAFHAMFKAARRREFDVLVVWRYDRFARSLRELVNALAEFESIGIEFISYSEGADTTTPQGRLLFGIMASLAEFERSLIADRVRAGMARAKAQGKHTGRPALSASKQRQILELAKVGELSKRAIARTVGVSPQTISNVLTSKALLSQPELALRQKD
ncbi:recombinase family protein [Blastomonas sp.]|uniref:recombinase family protein n=1 Tax=Blastomonas sp. TaxID=1909299 RepID=UPI0035944E20